MFIAGLAQIKRGINNVSYPALKGGSLFEASVQRDLWDLRS